MIKEGYLKFNQIFGEETENGLSEEEKANLEETIDIILESWKHNFIEAKEIKEEVYSLLKQCDVGGKRPKTTLLGVAQSMGGGLLKSQLKRQKETQVSLNEKDFFIKRQQATLDSKQDEIYQCKINSEEGTIRQDRRDKQDEGRDSRV